MDDISLDLAKRVKRAGFVIYKMESLIEWGAENQVPLTTKKIEKHPICTICYTSGTTGRPKGVQITHKNMTSMLAAIKYSSLKQRPK
jgi:long-chain acyl-CoA synthetase